MKIIIGDVPPEDTDKEKGGGKKPEKGASKADKGKNGEQPTNKIIFAGYPPPDPKLSYDYLE